MSVTQIQVIADEISALASEVAYLALSVDTSSGYPSRGSVVKALPTQNRFKAKSMWVSLGDGTYQHLTGSKGLITTHARLDGYVSTVFEA
jgi:hypothetical protein